MTRCKDEMVKIVQQSANGKVRESEAYALRDIVLKTFEADSISNPEVCVDTDRMGGWGPGVCKAPLELRMKEAIDDPGPFHIFGRKPFCISLVSQTLGVALLAQI